MIFRIYAGMEKNTEGTLCRVQGLSWNMTCVDVVNKLAEQADGNLSLNPKLCGALETPVSLGFRNLAFGFQHGGPYAGCGSPNLGIIDTGFFQATI